MEMRFKAVVTIESQISTSMQSNLMYVSCTDPEGGTEGLDTLENHKATKPAFNNGPSLAHRWHFPGGPMMTRFYGNWILSPLIKKKS